MKDTHDIGGVISAAFGDIATATAGGAGDATEVDNASVDRRGIQSLAVALAFETTLAQDATLSLAVQLQETDDDPAAPGSPLAAGWADIDTAIAPLVSQIVATGDTGGSTESGVLIVPLNLGTIKRHVRAQVTPDLSAGSIDTATVATSYVLGINAVTTA